ncbi:MAG: hypothetical protein GF315_14315 [candidate division Zixibacteria bacterium]|nr:hypothetical protein [candidate division Zixibacteria bacterium]
MIDKRATFWFVVALSYAGFITYISSQPQLPTQDLGIDLGDKVMHVGAYFVFGIFWYKAFAAIKTNMRIPVIWIVFVYGMIFAAIDEFHQYFVPNREMEFLDFAADVLGIALAIILVRLWNVQLRKAI